MTAQLDEETPAQRRARLMWLRLKPIDYVTMYGPPARRCSGCGHQRPQDHAAGGRLDRLVLQDLARWASWDAHDWGQRSRPSVPMIAQRIGYSDRSVQYAMRRLAASGFIEWNERPGLTSMCRILRPVGPGDNAAAPVDDPVQIRAPRRANTGPSLHRSPATVAPERGYRTTDQPPVAPDRGLDESDRADARAQAAPQWRGDATPAPFGTGPPPLAGVRARPHRQDAGRQRAPVASPPSVEDVFAVLGSAVDDLAGGAESDPVSFVGHWTRAAARRLRPCPRCAAPAGEACRRRDGRMRKANHAERRIPR